MNIKIDLIKMAKAFLNTLATAQEISPAIERLLYL